MSNPASSNAHEPVSIGKIAFASAVGATIEWYDFFLYGVVTALVFNKLFFPSYDPLVGTLLAYTTFAVGFVARPVGGVIFGHFGDRIGRKTILVLTLLIMGLATFFIGLLPTYDSIGIWAPILLLFLRVMQGIGIGGEWGGAVLMAVEHSPKGRRGFYGSWPQIGVPAGLMLSAGVVALLSNLTDEQFLAWGWRVAFLLSGLLVAVGLYIRVKIIETPDFQKVKESKSEAAVPFVELLTTHPKNVLLGMGARYIEGVCFNIFGVFIITYVTTTLQLPRSTALMGVIIASAIMIVMVPLYGMLSDRIGRRTIYCCGAAAIGILVFPSFWLMNTYREAAWVWFAIVLPFSFAYPAVYGPQAALFSELFSPRVRYTGISFVYQFSGIFASGLTPLIATALLGYGNGQPWWICAYVAVVAAISFLSVMAMRFHHTDPTPDARPAPSGRLGTAMPK
ncbi:MHS family MFS transporter [Azospirillum sp. RWY-5-1]|uniref:MHS family MFS transporter n=1 Tax=Azospirillum oleiclasticum TaxID=2735135 RepID=A0ABX2TEU2_9PROT|nr:MFS transporter [Azospirillum oleiclasticum]NYZ14199.1 MHS family MFS transporter [Azospirillum oleiclasticum]NYZ21683.1 MHS family MFS transporter [Azospirillum oleiclasticum]